VSADLLAAQKRAHRLYPRSQGFRGAYMKGVHARRAGRSIDACPYPADPTKTWRRAWRLAWTRGWQSLGSDEESG